MSKFGLCPCSPRVDISPRSNSLCLVPEFTPPRACAQGFVFEGDSSTFSFNTLTSLLTNHPILFAYTMSLAYDHALLPGPYLNAAYIPPFHDTSLSFVVSQAPLPETYTEFYTHVVQQKVRVVVNLTPLVEKGKVKAHQYWPDAGTSSGGGGAEGKAIALNNGWKVSTDSEKKVELEGGEATLIKRLIHIETGEHGGWGVTQFHLTSWPDHGVFPTKTLLQLIHETQMVPMPKIFPPPPTWIHCSAGVGRSGTLAAAYIAQAATNNAKHGAEQGAFSKAAQQSLVGRNQMAQLWDLPVRIVEHLRRYRARMVQTIEQFEAVYEIVAELATEAGLTEK